MKELGFATRMYELLKQNVKQDLGNVETSDQSNSAKMKEGEGVFEIVKKDFKVNIDGEVKNISAAEQLIEFSFMLISNFTTNVTG